MTVFIEDWQAAYGSPYLVQPDDQGVSEAALVEDGPEFKSHPGLLVSGRHERIAFVDGVRRGEAALYQHEQLSGQVARGVAGSHACGGVIADGEHRPEYTDQVVQRLVIWGSGKTGGLPDVTGGWHWDCRSIADEAPDAPLAALQQRMRQQEAVLADRLCAEGHLVLVDGPLSYLRNLDLPVVGYVKTHSKALLAPEYHRRIPELRAGERSSIFSLGRDRYSCYMRLAPVSGLSGPWAGVVRLEVPQSAGLQAAIWVVDRVAGIVPRYAGIAYRDPRAPQNLQPVGALEARLRHLLGEPGLAYRAVREAIHKLSEMEAPA
jgi:hypothetical protein